MDESSVNIKVFSDSGDTVSITSALKQLSLKGIPVNYSLPKSIEPDDNESNIIIIHTPIKTIELRIIPPFIG